MKTLTIICRERIKGVRYIIIIILLLRWHRQGRI